MTTNTPQHAMALSSFEEAILILLVAFLIMTGVLFYRIIMLLSTLDAAAKELSRSSLPVLHHLSGVLRDTERLTHWIESMKEGLDKTATEHLFSIFSRVSTVGNALNRVATVGRAIRNAVNAYRHPEKHNPGTGESSYSDGEKP